jgi:hypothetical protein
MTGEYQSQALTKLKHGYVCNIVINKLSKLHQHKCCVLLEVVVIGSQHCSDASRIRHANITSLPNTLTKQKIIYNQVLKKINIIPSSYLGAR